MTALQLNRIIDLFQRWVELQEKRLDLEFPPPTEPVDAQFVKVGEGDAVQPESKEEYDEFPTDQPASFESIIAKLKNS
jgi:hypothetical protein